VGERATLTELEGDPHPLLARLRAAEPVSWLPALGGWLVTRFDLAARVMRDGQAFTVDDPRFSTARVVGPSMLSLDGSEHDRHRAPFSGAFGADEVRARLAPFVQGAAGRLITGIERDGAAELRRSVAGPLAVHVVAEALGLGGVDPRTVLSWYDAIVGAVSGIAAGDGVSAAGTEAFGQLSRRLESVIAGHADSALLSAVNRANRLSSREVISNAAVMMFGGIETTEGMITNAVLHLLSNPDQLALVRVDPGLLPNGIEESLRMEPAAALVDRYATRDAELGGARIRRGDLVSVSVAGAGRDPSVFPDPDRYDVSRENAGRHLGFARGAHFCLGVHLARLETHTVIAGLLDRLPGLRLDPDRPSSPRGLVFRKPPTLHVLWDHADR
jgi:cytochrome P450